MKTCSKRTALSYITLSVVLLSAVFIVTDSNQIASVSDDAPTSFLSPTKRTNLKKQPAVLPSADSGKLLREWADSILISAIEVTLAELDDAEARRVLLSSWSARDLPGMAIWFANRNAADELHQEARDRLVQVLSEHDPAAMFGWMERYLPASAVEELAGPFFLNWADSNPSGAAAELRRLVTTTKMESPVWNNVLSQFAAQWSGNDLPHALSWVQALPDGAAKSRALVQVSYRWAAKDPLAAANYAAERNDAALISAVAGTWAERDPKSATTWAFRLPPGERQMTALTTALAVWAQLTPKTAAAYADTLPAGELSDQARITVASNWAYTDPGNAAKWAEQFAEGPAREKAFEQLANSWGLSNADETSRWLQRLPSTNSRNQAVSAFCEVIGATSPDVAFEWAETISVESLRHQRMEQAAIFWLQSDPTAARQFIARSSLPAGVRDQLVADVPGRRN